MTGSTGAGGRHVWTPAEMDRLERAIVEGDRVQISRRGSEFVVLPLEVHPGAAGDVLLATTVKGEDMEFALDELDSFDVI